MNGYEKRRQRIIHQIKKIALDLFMTDGADKVRMDEIAAKARVSKVTIYKYFHSKEELQRAVMDMYIDEILEATEKVLDSDLDFFEKLKFTLVAKLNSRKMADSQPFFELLEKYGQNGEGNQSDLNSRIKDIMFRFYEQGKKEGYIEEGIPFDLLFLYSEIFEAGFKAKSFELQPILADPQAFDQLLHTYYFGAFKRK
ncbi:MAG: TetR/AcrR family transcriptional regulator [Anaerolineaceae bacterium]|nr:TetR/AcrR family transcriptional regulator [Anaerolineaceae bacterium]